MSFIKTITGTIRAAMSPNQMTQQYSRPRNTSTNNDLFNYTYKKEGLKISDYEDMLRDPQIKSGFELIRMFLLSRKLIVTPASKEEKDKDIADKIEKTLNNMKYPLRKVRNDMYSALPYGYSVSEVVYTKQETQDYIGIERIRPIPIDTLEDCFEYDGQGDVVKVIQKVSNEDIEIPAEKCLIYTYDEQFGDRDGNSILDALYDIWYWKQKLETLRLIYLQKHESPTLVGKVTNPQFKDLMREQLEEIREGRTQLTIGPEDDISVLESSHRGEGFDRAIEYYNTMIYRVLGIGTLIMGQQEGKGAYAQSQTQDKIMGIRFDGIHEDIAAELQVKINELCDLNWDVTEYPSISFETFEEKDLLSLIEALKPLIDAAAINPMDQWFKQLVSDVVSRYSDVDTSELLEEETFEGLQEPHIEVVPTSNEQEAPQSTEQIDLIKNIAQTIPAKEEV
ncbi:MAG: DUF935 family protein [Burkholderiaceae bacterium]|nr:DUF935 family protein [Burkholderiaceae bacterium]